MTAEAEKGINIFEYDITISENRKKELEEAGKKITKSENGKYYLIEGKYSIGIEMNGKKVSKPLEVK